MVGFDKHAIYDAKTEAVLAGLVGAASDTYTAEAEEATSDTAADTAVFRTKYSRFRWQEGDKGSGVKAVQRALVLSGAAPALDVDGDFGPATKAAVVAFQEAHKLEADGVVGENTWEKLIDAVNAA